MMLFGAAAAGIYPILHLGRPWLAYWLFFYPEHDGAVAAVPQPAAVGLLGAAAPTCWPRSCSGTWA